MLSFPEILVILIVAVIVLGPKRLPETARKIGRWIGIFKQASEEFKKELMTMDRAVNDTLNRATSDIDQLEPEVTQVFENVEASITDVMNATTLPPAMTPDDAWDQTPIPGGLAPEPPQNVAQSTPTETNHEGATASEMGADQASNKVSPNADSIQPKLTANSAQIESQFGPKGKVS